MSVITIDGKAYALAPLPEHPAIEDPSLTPSQIYMIGVREGQTDLYESVQELLELARDLLDDGIGVTDARQEDALDRQGAPEGL
jgi:hypothetical protein